MADFKVYCRVVFQFSLLLCPTVVATAQHQDRFPASIIIPHLLNDDNEKLNPQELDSVAIILITKRMCEDCFVPLCEAIPNYYPAYANRIFVIYFTEKDIMKMLSYTPRFQETAPCAKEIHYCWTDQKTLDQKIQAIIAYPSPQLLLIANGTATHISYSDTINLLGMEATE